MNSLKPSTIRTRAEVVNSSASYPVTSSDRQKPTEHHRGVWAFYDAHHPLIVKNQQNFTGDVGFSSFFIICIVNTQKTTGDLDANEVLSYLEAKERGRPRLLRADASFQYLTVPCVCSYSVK